MDTIRMVILLAVVAAVVANGADHEVVSSRELGAAELKATEEVWTEERMAAAQPHPALLSGGDPDRVLGPPHPEVVAMLLKEGLIDEEYVHSGSLNRTAAQWVDRSGLPAGTSMIDTAAYALHPFKSIGRVFGTDGIFGGDFVCSGAIVGDGVVMTAGHCCGHRNVWNRNMMISLQYANGCGSSCTKISFGSMNTPNGWLTRALFQYDYCFAKISGAKPGYSLGLVVSVAQSSRVYVACGYPMNLGDPPGRYIYCTRNAQSTAGQGVKGIPSKLGEGSSGGPWIIGTMIAADTTGQVNTNYVNGLNSHIYPGKLVMYSPNFDATTMWTYEQALR